MLLHHTERNLHKMTAANTAQTFWSRVNKNGPRQPHMRSRCWVWVANLDRDGYGRITWQNKTKRATHVAWFLSTEQWPSPGALHRCDTRSCIRFSHLFEGGALENNRDTHAKGRNADIRGDRNPARKHPEKIRRGEQVYGAKFSASLVRRARKLYATGKFTQTEVSKQTGISRPQLCMILNRKAWRHV